MNKGFKMPFSWALSHVSNQVAIPPLTIVHTSNTHSWSDIDLDRSFLRQFVASLYFDWAIDGANDRVAIVGVSRRAVSTVQMRESNCRRDHDWVCRFVCACGAEFDCCMSDDVVR